MIGDTELIECSCYKLTPAILEFGEHHQDCPNYAELVPNEVSEADVQAMVAKQVALLQMGNAITSQGKHMYEGTVPASTVAARRARNRRARAARRVHRRARH